MDTRVTQDTQHKHVFQVSGFIHPKDVIHLNVQVIMWSSGAPHGASHDKGLTGTFICDTLIIYESMICLHPEVPIVTCSSVISMSF